MFYLPLEISRYRVINYNVNSVMLNLTFSFCLQGAQLRKHIDATLGSGNLREAVRLPPGEDINEWLAVNSNILPFCVQFSPNLVIPLKLTCLFCFAAVDFFNQVNLLYGTLTEFCTPESCPTMTAGPKWAFTSFHTFYSFGLSKYNMVKIIQKVCQWLVYLNNCNFVYGELFHQGCYWMMTLRG